MKVVLMVAERKEQEAGARLGQYQEHYNQERAQLSELESYESHYLETYAQAQKQLQSEQMIRYSDLITRLGEGLAEQKIKIQSMEKNLQELRLYWHRLNKKKCMIEDMIQRITGQENDDIENRLQKELDDLVRSKPRW